MSLHLHPVSHFLPMSDQREHTDLPLSVGWKGSDPKGYTGQMFQCLTHSIAGLYCQFDGFTVHTPATVQEDMHCGIKFVYAGPFLENSGASRTQSVQLSCLQFTLPAGNSMTQSMCLEHTQHSGFQSRCHAHSFFPVLIR